MPQERIKVTKYQSLQIELLTKMEKWDLDVILNIKACSQLSDFNFDCIDKDSVNLKKPAGFEIL